MIGFGYRKLAKEYGMTIKHGVAYGNMHGYPATLSEGMGFKIVASERCDNIAFLFYEILF